MIDREEFEEKLKRTFDPLSFVSNAGLIIENLLFNRFDDIASIRVTLKKSQATIDGYLTQYDNSNTDEEKSQVVESVVYNANDFVATAQEIIDEKLLMSTEIL